MKHILSTSIALSALIVATPALAQDDTAPQAIEFEETAPQGPPSDDAVAYEVNGEAYTFGYMMQFAALLVPNLEQYDISLIYPIMSELAVEQVLAADKARELELDMTPELQASIELVINSILSNAYLEQEVEKRLTPEAIQAKYDEYTAAFAPQQQATASHILLNSEEDALAAVARLDAGEDFAALAQELSTGPSGPNGGALGTFGKGQMVEPFENAVFAMEVGTYTTEPVQTQFGYHLIFLTDLAETAPDSFALLESQLRTQLEEEIQTEIREGLRADAEYSITDYPQLDRPAEE